MRVMFSSMLFEPFARAEIEDRGGEEDDGCDSENGVVHERKNRLRMLRKCSEVDKEVVRSREAQIRQNQSYEGSKRDFSTAGADAFTGSEREVNGVGSLRSK